MDDRARSILKQVQAEVKQKIEADETGINVMKIALDHGATLKQAEAIYIFIVEQGNY